VSDPMHERIARARARLEREPGTWPAKRRLAAALRRLLDALTATAASEDELLALAEHVDAAATRFAAQVPTEHGGDAAEAMASGMENFHDRSPLVGRANPLAPPAVIEHDEEGGRIVGTVTFGNAFEGGPGLVHGGFLASLLDEALGMATTFSGGPGMTGELTVRYHRATPTNTELGLVARFDRKEERRIHTSGEITLGDDVCASATGLFIAVPYDRFVEFQEERARRARDGVPGRDA